MKLPELLKFGASIVVDLLVSHKLMRKTAGTKVSESGNYFSFRDMMSPEEVATNTPNNPYASRNSFHSYLVDNCAEIFAVNNSLKDGSDINNIFINTKSLWDEEYAPLCDNYKITFRRFKTPNSLKGK